MILKKGTNSESLVLEAKKYLGLPSKEQNPMGFQGEEFIQTVLGKFAYESFHNSYAELGRYGKMIIDANDLQKGDLVYFMDLSKTEPSFSHAGIYIEDGKFIYLSSQKGVTIGSLEDSEYWKSKFAFGTRVLN
jgi:cell wall-associated NlpC family hydrolase